MSLSSTVDKRRRRTKGQIEKLRMQISAVLKADHPQSIRHVFYRMTDPRLDEPVEKSDRGYRHVQYQLTEMRRAGLIPYGWITDATRRGFHVQTFGGAADFLRRLAGLYREDMWRYSPHFVEVWSESRSIAGVIEGVCRDLAVSLYPAGGFSSITLAYQAAELINIETGSGEKSAEIIFIGDYDPAGVLIDESIRTELDKHLHQDVDLNFHRIAINQDQIAEYDLPTKPRKRGDRRSLHITETVEAEAMPAAAVREILRRKIESYLPPRALEVARVAEEDERATLLEMVSELEGFA